MKDDGRHIHTKKEREREREDRKREREICYPPFAGSLPKCLQQIAWTTLKLNLGLPHGWQRPTYLSHHLLSPRVCLSRKLDSGVQPQTQVRWYGCEHPKWHHNLYGKCLPQQWVICIFLNTDTRIHQHKQLNEIKYSKLLPSTNHDLISNFASK